MDVMVVPFFADFVYQWICQSMDLWINTCCSCDPLNVDRNSLIQAASLSDLLDWWLTANMGFLASLAALGCPWMMQQKRVDKRPKQQTPTIRIRS